MNDTATVLDLKTKLAGEDLENIPVERQRLIYSGRVMKNDDALSTYKIKNNNTIHMVKSAASNQQPNQTPTASASTATPAPANMAAGTANQPFAGLTGARYAGFGNGLPGLDMFGPDGGVRVLPLSCRGYLLTDTFRWVLLWTRHAFSDSCPIPTFNRL
jgi:ubiquilin